MMGVSGSGKSTVGELLGETMNLPFYDGDDYHSDENVAKMADGVPLTDEDRAGWLESLCLLIREKNACGVTPIIACSALKEAYRDKLRSAAERVIFMHLTGDPETLAARMDGRSESTDHFMKGTMLDSQLEALEDPASETDTLDLDITEPPSVLAEKAQQYLKTKFD